MPELSLGSALAAALVALIGVFLVQHLWTRFKYDLCKIPLAYGSVPILGKSAEAAAMLSSDHAGRPVCSWSRL